MVVETIGSTQDEARRRATEGAPEGLLVWALEQTRGRGRLDRTWVSPAGSGLWFSLVLRPRLAPEALPWLTLAAGVGVASGLRDLSGADLRLKWPNDVLLDGAKLGGILAEAESAASGITFVVLGVGINLRRPPGGFDAALQPPPAALEDTGAPAASPAEAMAAVLGGIETAYDVLSTGDVDATRQAWLDLSATIGSRVSAQGPGMTVEGVAVDLGSDGALVIETDDGRRTEVRSGEVLHLR